MRRKTTRNIVKQYFRYTRKLNELLSKKSKSPKISWLKSRLKKLRLIIDAAIKNHQLKTKKIVTTAAIAAAVTAGLHAQVLELKHNDSNPFYDVVTMAQAKPHFVDFDGDGDDDLFMTSYIEYFTDGIRDNGLHYYQNNDGVYEQETNIPFPEDLGLSGVIPSNAEDVIVTMDFIDFDGDGDLDAFAGIDGGSGIVYLENIDGTFSVNSDANPFSDIILSEVYFNDIEIGDIDGDGALDAVIVDDLYVQLFSLEDGKYIEGDTLAEGVNAAPTLFDIDGDSDLDLIIGNKYGNIDIYENVEGSLSVLEDHPFSSLFLEYTPSAGFSDINGDGDIDVVFGITSGALRYYEKEGDSYEYVTYNPISTHFYGASSPRPEFADIDGDGDNDLLLGTEISYPYYLENTNEGFQVMTETNPFIDAEINMLFVDPECGDVDEDGDVDCLFVSTYDGEQKYFENVDGDFVQIDSLSNPFLEYSEDENQIIVFEDFDEDGDLDLFVGNKYGDLFYYENNDGSYVEQASVAASIDFENGSGLHFGDVDNDGDNDLVITEFYGDVRYYMKDGLSLTKLEGEENPFNAFENLIRTLDFHDFDGDSDLDILVADVNNRALYIENLSTPSSVSSELFNESTTVYPNPSANSITLEMPWIEGKTDIFVYGINGQFVKKITTSSISEKISVLDLSPGNYHLKIVNMKKTAIVKFAVVR